MGAIDLSHRTLGIETMKSSLKQQKQKKIVRPYNVFLGNNRQKMLNNMSTRMTSNYDDDVICRNLDQSTVSYLKKS